MKQDDAHLVQRWRSGDDAAATAIVDRYANAMGAVAYAVLEDYALAEDAVQDAFVRASNGLSGLKRPERVGSWLIAIARNLALDVARRRDREVALEDFDVADHASPARVASNNEVGRHIREAIDDLPSDQREIFMMKYIAGMRYHEIAEVLGISRDAVAQKLFRVRQKLQHQLEAFRS